MKNLSNLKTVMVTSHLKNSESVPPQSGTRRGAFTLIELLVVIAIIAILAAVLLPVLQAAKLRGEAATCIDHQKQLATAWIMYANDNNDNLVGNKWQDEEKWNPPMRPPENWISGWMNPSGSSSDESSGSGLPNPDSDNTNTTILVDSRYASLGDYTKNPLLFQCPSCNVMVDSVQGGQKSSREVRSVSMNAWVGYVDSPPTGVGSFKQFHKMSDISAGIDTADLFIFMEERGESIDDGSFAVDQGVNDMFNWPTDYHNVAATVGFGDGHVEVHRWFGTGPNTVDGNGTAVGTTRPPNPEPTRKWTTTAIGGAYLTDVRWLQKHSSIWNVPGQPAPY